MAFSFNFDIKVKTDECCHDIKTAEKDEEEDCLKPVKDALAPPPGLVKAAREHPLPSSLPPSLSDAVTECVCVGSLPRLVCLDECVQERTAGEREEEDDEAILKRSREERSDLISGVYEGGLRVWECTYDLLQHLDQGGVEFSGRRVLDLGCGAGLLGVMAMRLGAESVDFQDYNSTVITQLTIPNTLLNMDTHTHTFSSDEEEEEEEEDDEDEEEERGSVCDGKKDKKKDKGREKEKEESKREDDNVKKSDKGGKLKRGKGDEGEREEEDKKRKRQKREEEEEERRDASDAPSPSQAPPPCRFFSGDWSSFLSLIGPDPAHKYDIILTSETIYNTSCYPTLHQLFHRLLAPDGQVVLATKAHYFGVGGGLMLFQHFLEERGEFAVATVMDVEEGLQRHVVKITFKTRARDTHTS